MEAYEKYNFIHGDFHPANVLLKHSKQSDMTYSVFNENIIIDTYGLRSWIMDFENSEFKQKKDIQSNNAFYQDIIRFFMLLPSFINHINRTNIQQIVTFLINVSNNVGNGFYLDVNNMLTWINEYITL